MNGHYTFISGHLEAGEGATNAMIREAKEEAGIILTKENVFVGHITHRKCSDREYIDIFFVGKDWIGEPKNMEPEKCDDMQWFHQNELPENILPNVRFALEAVANKNFYGEFGW